MTSFIKIGLALGLLFVGLSIIAAASAAGFGGGLCVGGALGWIWARRRGAKPGQVVETRQVAAALVLGLLLASASQVQARQVRQLAGPANRGYVGADPVRFNRGVLPAPAACRTSAALVAPRACQLVAAPRAFAPACGIRPAAPRCYAGAMFAPTAIDGQACRFGAAPVRSCVYGLPTAPRVSEMQHYPTCGAAAGYVSPDYHD